MKSRTVSLPDLVTEKKRNTALSLSEGFAGARHEAALAATSQAWAPKPLGGTKKEFTGHEDDLGIGLNRVLPLYYRTRQIVLGTEKEGHRVPQKMASELRTLEKAVGKEIRSLHPLLFQRFDDVQLDRLLRAMPFLRLSSGRWLFGSAELNAAWPASSGARSFILLSGKIALYPDPNGGGERSEITRGAIFGEKHFKLCDESMGDVVGAAAHCEEPCIVGLLSTEVLEASFADRAFGNRRIAQTMRHFSSFSRIVLPDQDPSAPKQDLARMTYAEKNKMFEERQTAHVKNALTDIAQVSTALHLYPGHQLLADDPLDECVLMVSKGSIEVRADICLTERMELKKALTRTPKERVWTDQVLFTLKANEAWGHERIMLGNIFKRTLEQAASTLAYSLNLDNFRILAAAQKGANDIVSVWKVSKNRFVDFVRKSQHEKQFLQQCSVSSLDKQMSIRAQIKQLIHEWEMEEQAIANRLEFG